jgi:hypothetical protein
MKTSEELRIRMEECMLEAIAILHDEGDDLFTILNNRFNIDRGMIARWITRRKR